jgi:hypothetical protein
MMWLLAIGSFLFKAGRAVSGLFTGGNLESILKTIDRGMESGDKKETIKAEVTKKWIDAQAGLLVGRTWWFQLFFVIPLGIYWSALLLASIQFGPTGLVVHPIPSPYYEWAAGIISALFIVDGSKAILGRLTGK